MHIGIFLSVVELFGDDLLAVAIREKVYRARWNDADQGGHETLE